MNVSWKGIFYRFCRGLYTWKLYKNLRREKKKRKDQGVPWMLPEHDIGDRNVPDVLIYVPVGTGKEWDIWL